MVRDRASSFLLGLAGHSPDTGAGNRPGSGPRAGWMIDLLEQTQAGLVIVVNQPAPVPAADQAGLIIDVTPRPIEGATLASVVRPRWTTRDALALCSQRQNLIRCFGHAVRRDQIEIVFGCFVFELGDRSHCRLQCLLGVRDVV